ncbi:hypothetical protein MKW98_000130, partial [Papaver atlanticum]
GYDQLDPHGMIEIKWDNLTWEDDTYNAQISKQESRHIEKPGWALTGTWQNDEVIWNMLGAEAKEQGDRKGGVLTTEIQDPSKYGAYFQMALRKALLMDIINGTAKPAAPAADDGDKEKQPPSKDKNKHDTGKSKEKRDNGKDKRHFPAKDASHDKRDRNKGEDKNKNKPQFNVDDVNGDKNEKEMKNKFHDREFL